MEKSSWFVLHNIFYNKIVDSEMDGYVADPRKKNTCRNLDDKSERKRTWEI
jgi:hypothetical protein